MIYVDFNKSVLEFYIERANSSFCNLAIDDIDVKSIIEDLSFFKELQQDWYLLLESVDDIPQYFGLIAIQCLAASQREADKENDIGENEYQIRLKQLLNIESDAKLQNLYKGINSQNPIQEQIWFAAKDFLQNRYSLELSIPSSNTHAGRYVQYPKSQSLFTIEDLKRFTPFFSETFVIYESISLEYFKEQCKNNFQNIPLRQRAKDLLKENEKGKRCYDQAFNYFNHWDGTIYSFDVNNNQIKKCQTQYTESSRLILFFDNNEPKIHLNTNIIVWRGIFLIPNYHYFEKGILLFSEHEYYKNEYEEVRVLEKNKIGYIVLNSIQKSNEFVLLNQHSIEKIDFGNSIFLFKVNTNDGALGANFKPNPAKLKGGIKISRKREYLLDFPPTIECDEAFSIVFEHKRIETDPFSKIGKYKIRIKGYKDIEIEIKAPQKIEGITVPLNKGWNIQKLFFDREYPELEGTILNLKNQGVSQSITRNWIDVNLKKVNKNQNNHLLNTINKAKYGNLKN
jgi:hypothetical protein